MYIHGAMHPFCTRSKFCNFNENSICNRRFHNELTEKLLITGSDEPGIQHQTDLSGIADPDAAHL